MTTEAFNPLANTYALTVTGSSATVTIPTPSSISLPVSLINYVMTNVGTQTIFVNVQGADSSPTAAIPSSGSSSTCTPIIANTQVSFSFPAGVVIAAIAADTGSTLYVTPGSGV